MSQGDRLGRNFDSVRHGFSLLVAEGVDCDGELTGVGSRGCRANSETGDLVPLIRV